VRRYLPVSERKGRSTGSPWSKKKTSRPGAPSGATAPTKCSGRNIPLRSNRPQCKVGIARGEGAGRNSAGQRVGWRSGDFRAITQPRYLMRFPERTGGTAEPGSGQGGACNLQPHPKHQGREEKIDCRSYTLSLHHSYFTPNPFLPLLREVTVPVK
jgi:hypothetical protein